ncbi:MAG: hypothetical protein HY581_00795 [Nitrospirae bacterium]|nr:hypothetical protein [Nitrospirota bacterium]
MKPTSGNATVQDPILFTPDELRLVADDQFFLVKARIMKKVRGMLDGVYAGLREELAGVKLLAPPGFDRKKFQFVKGEHLEDFPYQYLDFPKYFEGDDKFTFRTLFWWGHHVVFALILEGPGLLRYKQNLLNRYHVTAGRHLCLSLAPSLWEWRQGEGYTLPLSHDRKSEVAAVLSGRPFFKLARFVSLDDPALKEGRIVELGREALRAVLPVITP